MMENTKLVILAGGASSRMKKKLDAIGSFSEEEKQANMRSKGLISFDNSGRPFLIRFHDFFFNMLITYGVTTETV
jgi:hypothetical protein